MRERFDLRRRSAPGSRASNSVLTTSVAKRSKVATSTGARGPTSSARCTASTSTSASTRSDRHVRRVRRGPRGVRHRREDLRAQRDGRAAREGGRGRVLQGRASPFRDRVDWSRHQAPVARPHRVLHAARLLRTPDRGAAGRRGRRTARRNRAGPAPGQGGSDRVPAGNGGRRPRGPVDDPGHGRDHRPSAPRFGDRRRAHHARGDAPRRHRLELRDRPGGDDRAPPVPLAARPHVPLVPAQRRAPLGRRRARALRPHAGGARRRARAVHHRLRTQHRRRLLRHHACALARRGRTHRHAGAGAKERGVRACRVRRSTARSRSTKTPRSWPSASA